MTGVSYYDWGRKEAVKSARLNIPWDASGNLQVPIKLTGKLDTTAADTVLQDHTVINADVQLTGSTADGFANSTNLYILNMDSATQINQNATFASSVVASTFTVKGGNLTVGTDVLGSQTACVFGGATYLESADSTYNITTENISVGGKFNIADWGATASQVLFSRYQSSKGYRAWLVNGVLSWVENATTIVSANLSGLSGYHGVEIKRTNGGAVYIVVDGVVVASGTTAVTITDSGASNFQIGAADASLFLTGSVDEFFFHKATVHTADESRNIYARSAKKFAVKDQNGKVAIGNNTGVAIYETLSTSQVLATPSNFDTNMLEIIVPENGLYRIEGTAQAVADRADCFISMRYNSDNTTNYGYKEAGGGSLLGAITLYPCPHFSFPKHCLAGDSIKLRVYCSGQSGNITIYGDNTSNSIGATSLFIQKIA